MPRKLFTAQVNHSGRLLLRRAPVFEVRPRCPAHPAHSQPFRGQPRARTAPTHLSSPPAPMTPRRRCERSQENALRGRMQKRKAGLRPRLIGGGCSRRPRLCTATPRIAVMVLPSPLAQARRAGEKGEGDFRSLHARGADIPAEPRLTTPRCTFGAALLDLPLSNTTVGVGGRKGRSAAAVLASRHHRRDLSSAARTAAALATIT